MDPVVVAVAETDRDEVVVSSGVEAALLHVVAVAPRPHAIVVAVLDALVRALLLASDAVLAPRAQTLRANLHS